MMNKRIVYTLLTMMLVATLAACSSTQTESGQGANRALPTVTAVNQPSFGFTPEIDYTDCEQLYPNDTFTIYQQAGLTGPLAASFGNGFLYGAEDALAAINAAGGVCGITLTIKLTDTQYDPAQELAAYEAIREQNPPPPFVLTYGSGAAVVLKDRVIEDQIVNITAGLDAESFYIPRDGWTVGVAPIYSDQFAGFLTWLKDNWDQIKPANADDEIIVGSIGWANAFGNGATTPEALDYARELGITVLPLEEHDTSPTADVTGQVQNLLSGGANVIWIQSLSQGPVQVISTIHALGAWDDLVVGGVNWAMNRDLLNLLGEDAELATDFYGVLPLKWWNDTEDPAIQRARDAFGAGGHPESDQGVSYLISYGEMFAVAEILQHAINQYGFENLDGPSFFAAMQDLGTISAAGIYQLDVRGENRAPDQAHIRQAQLVDGTVQFVPVSDFFELPDTRPAIP